MAFDRAAERERQIQREMTHCRHFTGVQHASCSVGVDYDTVRRKGVFGLVCLDQAHPVKCERISLPDRAEAERIVDEREEHVRKMLERLAIGVCQCGVRGEDWVQHGHCIYAKPCGHRVGQGDASAYKRAVLEARAKETRP